MLSMKFGMKERPNLTSSMRSRTADVQTVSTDLDSLHSKLQIEADKFVRWKVSTEVNLNQKERQLQGSQETIKILKNNVIQLQLGNENVTQSLQRERQNKELIDSKVSTTRRLVEFVQQQQNQICLSVQEFANIRHRLSANQDQSLTDITILCDDFKKLEVTLSEFMKTTHEKAKTELEKILSEKQILQDDLKKEEIFKEQLQLQIESQLRELKIHSDTIASFEAHVKCAEEEIVQMKESISSLSNDLQNCRQAVLKSEKSEEDLKIEIDKRENEVKTLEGSNNDLNDKLTESKAEFVEAAEKISFLKRCNETLEGRTSELVQQVETLSLMRTKLEEDLEIINDKLNEVIFTSKENEITLKRQLNDLQDITNGLRSEKVALKEELVSALDNLVIANEETTNKAAVCEEQSITIESLTSTVSKLESELKERIKSMTANSKKSSMNKKKLESAEKKLANFKEDLVKEKEALSTMKEEIKRQIMTEKQVNSELLSNLNANEQERNELKEKLKELEQLKDQAFAECAENKELCTGVKVEYEIKIKEMDSMIDQCKRDNEQIVGAKNEEINDVKKEMEDIQIKFVETISEKENSLHTANQNIAEKVALCDEQSISIETLTTTISELEAEIKTKSKSMISDEKKATMNRKKLDCVEKKLANYKEKLTKEKEELKRQVEAEKQINGELRSKCDTKDQESNKLKIEIEELEQLKDKAFAEAVQHKNLCINIQLESDSKIKEMVNMLDQYKQVNEKNVLAKDEEINDIKRKMKDIQTKLSEITSEKLSSVKSPDPSTKDDLKTPSPSVYLSLCRPMTSKRSGGPSKNVTDPQLKSRFLQTASNRLNLRRVSFQSPLLDSDSSDLNTIELGSDLEDKFESLRKTGLRSNQFGRAKIPQAKVHPLAAINETDSVRKTPNKKPRLNRPDLKTYSGQGSAKNGSENKSPSVFGKRDNKDTSQISFQKVFKFD